MSGFLRAAALASAAVLLGCGSNNPPPVQKPSINSFSASPASIAAGSSSTLSWSVTGADNLSIDSGVGAVTGTSTTVAPSATTTYTLTATNAGGSVAATATVTVTPPAPTIGSFTATPSSIAPGASSTLAWSVSGAQSLSIDHGVGTVTGTSVAVSPPATTTYTLTATAAGGATATAQATVAIASGPPVILSFTVAPNPILPGGTATLSWTTARATSLSLDNGIGAVTGTSRAVSPSASTAYTLTASGAGTPATATVTVHVLHLVYTDPPAGGLVRLVTHASNPAHIVLDLVVGAAPQVFFGAAVNFKLDTSRVAFNPSTGLDVSTSALGPTASAETAAKALLPVSGPLAGTLVAGVAHRKTSPTDLDQTLAPGALIARFTFDLAPTATPGPIIDLGNSSGVLLTAALTPVASLPDFAVGTLAVAQ